MNQLVPQRLTQDRSPEAGANGDVSSKVGASKGSLAEWAEAYCSCASRVVPQTDCAVPKTRRVVAKPYCVVAEAGRHAGGAHGVGAVEHAGEEAEPLRERWNCEEGAFQSRQAAPVIGSQPVMAMKPM